MLALSTGSLHNYGLDRVFALACRTGFQGVEVIVDTRWDTRQSSYLRELVQRHSIPIVSLHAPFIHGIQGWDGDALSGLRRTVQLASSIDVPVVICHLPMRWHWISVEGSPLRRRLRTPVPCPRSQKSRLDLLQGARELGNDKVKILLENMPANRWMGIRYGLYAPNAPEELARFPDLVLDTTHVGTWGWDLMEVYERLKASIRHVHLSDFNGREHILPGRGNLPLADLLRRVARDGFDGSIVVETGPEYLGAHDEEQVALALRGCSSFCFHNLNEGVVV